MKAHRKISARESVRRREKNFLADNYLRCWNYIKETKNFIFIVVGIFFIFALIGFFVPAPSEVNDFLMKYVKQIVDQVSGFSPAELIAFIFFNNAKSSLFGWIFGILLGIFPVLFSIFNGYLLGFVSKITVQAGGFFVLWKLLPHGIFELPAVFISLGMGMKLGIALLKDKEEVKENFLDASRVFLSVVVPLLVIAAIIEGALISVLG